MYIHIQAYPSVYNISTGHWPTTQLIVVFMCIMLEELSPLIQFRKSYTEVSVLILGRCKSCNHTLIACHLMSIYHIIISDSHIQYWLTKRGMDSHGSWIPNPVVILFENLMSQRQNQSHSSWSSVPSGLRFVWNCLFILPLRPLCTEPHISLISHVLLII